jgi:hypothetical protein
MLLYYIDGMGGCSAVRRGGAKSLLSRAGVELSDPTCAHLGIVRAGIDMHTFRDYCQGLSGIDLEKSPDKNLITCYIQYLIQPLKLLSRRCLTGVVAYCRDEFQCNGHN